MNKAGVSVESRYALHVMPLHVAYSAVTAVLVAR